MDQLNCKTQRQTLITQKECSYSQQRLGILKGSVCQSIEKASIGKPLKSYLRKLTEKFKWKSRTAQAINIERKTVS